MDSQWIAERGSVAQRPERPGDSGPNRTARPASTKTGAVRTTAPPLPDDVSAYELDPQARRELRSLPKDLAEAVACRLVMVGRLIDADPAAAYLHAAEARRMARRVGVVREACGFAAYRAEHWAEALAELRAARRMTGSDAYVAVIADCERGMGRPERALAAVRSTETGLLDRSARVELRIVESGARRDLGQYDAAVQLLRDPQLHALARPPYVARLFYAYADALRDAGKIGEAEDWLARAAAADEAGETDAGERLAELDAIEIIDTADDDGDRSAT